MQHLFQAVIFTQLFAASSFATIPTDQFCELAKGNYKIETANGVKPKPEAETASVEKDLNAQECVLTFPYCVPDASCDPGYQFLGFATTKVSETKTSTLSSYSIETEVNGKKLRFLLELDSGKLRFVNYQYAMPNNETVTLEHLGVKSIED